MALIMRSGESLHAKSGVSCQDESLAARRVWLGCHFIFCSNTSMSLRAPNVMRWTRLKDECLEVLNTSPAALASDKVLWQHIQLQHITEEFAMQLSAKETSPDRSRAVQTQLAHREFKRQLDEWRRGVADGCWDGKSSFFFLLQSSLRLVRQSDAEALEFAYHFSLLYINEVAYCAPTNNDATDNSPSVVATETHAIPEFLEKTDTSFEFSPLWICRRSEPYQRCT
ncbi:hypothetical protein KXV31_005083 [Aspergillus fumigatus]|nr:hypothetical protein KXX10_008728 [Aspergillus fumigatus]KAH1395257.1 hypothetical protein KXX49_009344 [Aspergillus fumigatus]KAH1435868.1 hypothetical protein KXX32_007692 [Aspergillus fumigatus]KAH1991337.1 hypothetical protein KXV33_006904 [Aspergillus fumigatus]KAH2017413.1 hypothetical protein KXV97_000244 [Aspergillus fumigatus]